MIQIIASAVTPVCKSVCMIFNKDLEDDFVPECGCVIHDNYD